MNAPVWTMVSPKGGAGKTTLALVLAGEIASYGKRVTLIDADPNQPLVRWKALDQGPANIDVVIDEDPDGGTILDKIETAQAKSDYVFIDTEGTNNNRASIATAYSDLVLIPIQSSGMDLAEGAKAVAFVDYMGRVHKRQIPRLIVRTLIDPAIVDRNEKEVERQIIASGEPICNVMLMRRSAFRSMMLLGCTLHTFDKAEAANLAKAQDNADLLLKAVLLEYRAQTVGGDEQQARAV